MKINSCPRCFNLVLPGETACSQCGAPAGQPAPSVPPRSSPSPESARRGVTVYLPPSTVVVPKPGSAEAIDASTDLTSSNDRKIVAVLITTTWVAAGQIFPVRDGRNIIGRSPECHIHVPEDLSLSKVNTYVTFRGSFFIGDMSSTGGTDVDGKRVQDQPQPLPNYARIRTGTTDWIFVILDPLLVGN